MEFDPAAAPTESTMVRYFEEGLKPSIKAEMDQDATHLDDYEELVAKAVRAEAKAGLQPSSYIRETDIQVLRGSWLAHTTAHKVQTQGAMNCGDESRGKGPAFTPASASTDPEPSDKARKDKKKKQHRDKRDSRESRDTLASEVNGAKVRDKKKRKRKDPREVNAIYPTFAKQLGLPIRPTDVGAQKIDSTTLDTYGMVIAAFSVENKANQVKFFE